MTLFFHLYLLKKIRLDVHVNPLPEDLLEISSHIFFEKKKTMKKYLKLSTAAVVIGA